MPTRDDSYDNIPCPNFLKTPMRFRLLAIAAVALGFIAHPAHAQERSRLTDITRKADLNTAEGPSAFFTGRVTITGQFQRQAPSRVGGALVRFEPGARTAWHTHPLGQTLIVTEGVGWTQIENGPRLTFSAGDILWCPPNHKHWHGATPDGAMSHIAIHESHEGAPVTWLEHVTDKDYLAEPAGGPLRLGSE